MPSALRSTDDRHETPRDRNTALRVSVIIPALNESDCIADAVRRAWASGAFEVLVVDGGSCDDTAELARAGRAHVLTGPRGRALQQNLGAHAATGEALLFLHADNWLDHGAVAQIVTALDDPTALGGAFRQQIEASGLLYRALELGNALRVRWRGSPYGDQGIFVRREVFHRLGGFPEVGLMEDVLLMKRFRRLAWPLLLAGPLHVSARRWQRHGVVRQTLRNWSLLASAALGISLDWLARFYPPHTASAADRADPTHASQCVPDGGRSSQ